MKAVYRVVPFLSAFLFFPSAASGTQTYTVVTAEMGINILGLGSGAAWGDLDGDGDLDLLASDSSYPYHVYVYRNDGSTFTDVTALTGIENDGRNFAIGDYDKDGLDDVAVVSRGYKATKLYRNLGSMTFEDVSDTAGIFGDYCFRCTWTDYDNDGWLDLYCCGSVSCLFRNQGDGSFIEVAASAGIQPGGNSCAWLDFDNDGNEDLYVSRSGTGNFLYHNMGNGTFEEIGELAGVADPNGSTGVCSGDYNGDGWFDLYSVNIASPRNTLYRNQGNGTFQDVTFAAGVEDAGDGRTATFIDIDSDGLVDLFTSNHVHKNRLYRNNGNGTFTDIASSIGIDVPEDAFGTGFADYDGDGDTDLFLATHWTSDLLRCSGVENHHVQISLIGTVSNINAFGAVVKCTCTSLETWMRVDGGHGKGDLDSRILCFGLGDYTGPFEIEIHWPSGLVETYTDLAADSRYDITEGQGVSTSQTAFRVSEPAGVLLSPNPASSSALLTVESQGGFYTGVYDLSGRLVWSGFAHPDGNTASLELPAGEWGAGLYTVRISSGSVSVSKRLAVIR